MLVSTPRKKDSEEEMENQLENKKKPSEMTKARSPTAHYRAILMGIKQDLLATRKAAAAELKYVKDKLQTEEHTHRQELRVTQEAFDNRTHTLEIEQQLHHLRLDCMQLQQHDKKNNKSQV